MKICIFWSYLKPVVLFEFFFFKISIFIEIKLGFFFSVSKSFFEANIN